MILDRVECLWFLFTDNVDPRLSGPANKGPLYICMKVIYYRENIKNNSIIMLGIYTCTGLFEFIR